MKIRKNRWRKNNQDKKCTLVFKTARGIKRSSSQNTSPTEQNDSTFILEQAAVTSENENINVMGGNADE